MGFLEHEVGVLLRLGLLLVRRALRRDERRTQERLKLAVALDLRLQVLDPVGELGPLAPCLLERLRDLLEQLVDGAGAIAEHPAFQVYVVELDWCDGHSLSSLS